VPTEEELDVALLERGAHSVALTPAGETLMVEGRRLLDSSHALVEKVKATAVGEPLRVGYAPSLAGDFLSLAIERFTQFHPRVRVCLYDWSSSEMRAGLQDGKLDLIVAAPCPGLQEPIRWVPLRDYGWQLVVPVNHSLHKTSPVAPADLHGQRLLLYHRQHYPDYWERVTGYFRELNLQAKIAGEFDGVSSLTAALEGNLGIALLAECTRLDARQRQRLVTLPLVVEPKRIEVAAGVRTDGTTGTQVLAFVEELRQAASESAMESTPQGEGAQGSTGSSP
jgi:DNA-binding transcriptional LysR family regulator